MLIRQVLVAAVSLLIAASTSGQSGLFVSQEGTLTAQAAGSYGYFGYSVALSGDTAIVGHANQTTADVFVRTGTNWAPQGTLIASDSTPGDYFGSSVAISGDTAVVGAWGDDHAGGSDAGSAYVFVRNGSTWTEQAKLIASDSMAADNFGVSVALEGDTAVVGANKTDHAGGNGAGSAYVYVRNGTTWSEQAKLTAADAAAGDDLGDSVAVSGDTALAGAWGDDDGGASSGSAYVFVRSGAAWTQQAKLVASDASASASFGVVSISGNTAVVGALGDNSGSIASGSAYVFVRNGTTWNQEAKIGNPEPSANDLFGISVAVTGNVAVVGASYDNIGGVTDAGSAYVFLRNGTIWTQQAKLTAPNLVSEGYFGGAVATSEDTAIIGSFEDDQQGTAAGAAFVYRLEPAGTWTDLGLGMAGTAGVPVLTGTGTLQAGTTITLSLIKAKPFAFAPVFIGISTGYHPFKYGVLVPNPDFIFTLTTDFFGKSSFGGLWPPGVPSGFKTYFQWWIQDPAAPKGFAASNAVAGTAP